jgi:pyrroline-5-carboxylate reductase
VSELEQLTEACVRLGAVREQAVTMAAQLLKRAAQLAAERGIPREAALAELLELVVRARAGEVSPRVGSSSPRAADEK